MSNTKKNIFYQTLYQMLSVMLPLLTTPYISRVLGAEMLGTYSYTYSITSYFVLFAMLGISNYGNRTIARVRDDRDRLDRTYSSILVLHLIVAGTVAVVYGFYVFTVSEYFVLALLQSFFVLAAVFDINWFFFGIEEFKLTVVRNSIIKIITVILVFLFVKDRSDLWKYCLIMSAGGFLGQSVVWLVAGRYVTFRKPAWKQVWSHFRQMLILFIPAIAISLYAIMDKIMLGSMSTKTQAGFYESAAMIVTAPMGVIAAFCTVMLPKMSNLAARGEKERSRQYMALSVEYMLIAAFAIAFGLAGVSRELAPVFLGREFIPASPLILLLAITIPFKAVAEVVRNQYLIPNNRDLHYIVSVFAGAAVNLSLNVILIPRFAALGAVIGTVAAEAVVCLVQCIFVHRDVPIFRYMAGTAFYAAAGLVMYIGVRLAARLVTIGVPGLILEILIGAGIYLALCMWYLIRVRKLCSLKRRQAERRGR